MTVSNLNQQNILQFCRQLTINQETFKFDLCSSSVHRRSARPPPLPKQNSKTNLLFCAADSYNTVMFAKKLASVQ